MKAKIIDFVIGFIKHRTFYSVMRHLKRGLPKLFGFSHCEVFMYDRTNKNLFCMSVSQNEPPPDEKEGHYRRCIEEDFTINEQ